MTSDVPVTRLSQLGHLVTADPARVVGTQVGAYRLVEKIGAGGMGAVWIGEHTLIARRAAIKLLHPSFSCRPDVVARFFNEARAATTIADPGIVQVFDFGIHADSTAYIVMELLEGETLDERCARSLSIPQALRILRQVASSLGAAHARGIIHRDLKPENIFLVRDPEVPGGERAKILDFGIAKLVGDPGHQTQSAIVMGTPAFMAPEQCRGARRVDARADIYSLGCVLFAALAGRPPFEAEGVGDLIVKHVTEPAPAVSSLVAGIPAAVDELVARCLEKDPDRRFASGSELATAINQLLESAKLTSDLAVQPPALPPVVTTLSSAVATSAARPAGRGRAFLIGGGLGVLVTAALMLARVPGPAAAIETTPDAPMPPPVPAEPPAPAIDLAQIGGTVSDTFGWLRELSDLAPRRVVRRAPKPSPAPAPPPVVEITRDCTPDPTGIPVCR